MENTIVEVQEDGSGEIKLFSNGNQAGKMDINIHRDILTVFHTEVDEAYEGRGFAKLLLTQLVSYAREKDLKVRPTCPYVHMQFKRHEDDYKDIWYKGHQL